MRTLRILRRLLMLNLVRQAEYRASFVLQGFEGLVQLCVTLATFSLIFRLTPSVAGWSQAQVLVLAGVYRAVSGVLGLIVLPNMYALSGYIRSGDLDYLLLRPVSSQLLVSARRMTVPEVWSVLIGVALIVLAGRAAHIHPAPLAIAESLVLVACGILLLYALFLFVATWCFWLVTEWLTDLGYTLFSAGKYPVSFFRGFVRTILTVAVPVAFATTFPTRALLGELGLRIVGAAIAFAAAAMFATSRFWTFALKRYSSASS